MTANSPNFGATGRRIGPDHEAGWWVARSHPAARIPRLGEWRSGRYDFVCPDTAALRSTMFLILLILSSAGMVLLYTLLAKLAARILSRTQISWKLAALFGVAVNIPSFVLVPGLVKAGIEFTAAIPIAMIFIDLALGAWIFHRRATNNAGQPAGWWLAAKLSALAQLMVVFVTVPLMMLRGHI